MTKHDETAAERKAREATEANAKAAKEAAQKQEAAAKKADETTRQSTAAQSGVVGANANVVQASIDHSNAVDEANRAAKEESDAKHLEARRLEDENAFKLSQAAAIATAGPDRTGEVTNAAGYDRPKLDVEPGTEEWHLKFPGEITSGQFNPREESPKEHADKMGQVNTDAAHKNETDKDAKRSNKAA